MQIVMSAWGWVAIGVTAFFAVGVVVAFAVASVLGKIATQVAALLENEEWSTAPVTKEKAVNDELTVRRATRSPRGSKIR